MKISKLTHVLSVLAGLAGVVTFAATIIGGADNLVWGVSKIDALFCSAILILIATWLQAAAIHHVMLEKQGEIV